MTYTHAQEAALAEALRTDDAALAVRLREVGLDTAEGWDAVRRLRRGEAVDLGNGSVLMRDAGDALERPTW